MTVKIDALSSSNYTTFGSISISLDGVSNYNDIEIIFENQTPMVTQATTFTVYGKTNTGTKEDITSLANIECPSPLIRNENTIVAPKDFGVLGEYLIKASYNSLTSQKTLTIKSDLVEYECCYDFAWRDDEGDSGHYIFYPKSISPDGPYYNKNGVVSTWSGCDMPTFKFNAKFADNSSAQFTKIHEFVISNYPTIYEEFAGKPVNSNNKWFTIKEVTGYSFDNSQPDVKYLIFYLDNTPFNDGIASYCQPGQKYTICYLGEPLCYYVFVKGYVSDSTFIMDTRFYRVVFSKSLLTGNIYGGAVYE